MICKYEFIYSGKANYPVCRMCVWSEVSRSGFYEGVTAGTPVQRDAGWS